jgi:hypothetical protein
MRGQGGELQLGSSHQCSQQIRVCLPALEGQSPRHQQDSDGRRRRKYNNLFVPTQVNMVVYFTIRVKMINLYTVP